MQDNTLEDIRSTLDDIRDLLLALNRDKLDDMKKRLLKPGSIENQVYELCDGQNSVQEISVKVQKSSDNINSVIGNLRKKGLVRSKEIGGKRVIVQIF